MAKNRKTRIPSISLYPESESESESESPESYHLPGVGVGVGVLSKLIGLRNPGHVSLEQSRRPYKGDFLVIRSDTALYLRF